jgi:uncharacterized membrane protein
MHLLTEDHFFPNEPEALVHSPRAKAAMSSQAIEQNPLVLEESGSPALSVCVKPASMRAACSVMLVGLEDFEENRPVEDLVPLLSRWIHIGTSIVLVGGTVFMRFVLAPAASASLSDTEHAALRERVVGTWKRYVHAGILLFLLSGLYNYLVVARPKHDGDSLYHALMGTKILLALAVFFFASALVGRSQGLQKIRDKRNTWLLVLILLSAVIVGIAGFLKVRAWVPKTEAAMAPVVSLRMG